MVKQIDRLTPLTEDEVKALSNEALCDRMEAVLYTILCESYTDPRAIDLFPRQSIKEFFHTKIIQSLPEIIQRDALRKCFEYLVQLEYLSRCSGWLNDAVYGAGYDENQSWLSPRIQNINCAVNQIKIVGSGIACDRMMDLLHIIDAGKTLEGKSKFKPFRKWLLNPDNRFVFFAPNLSKIYKFRSVLRQAEAHEWSKQPGRLLQLQRPSYEESNDPLKLLQILNWMWAPLLILLNDETPTSTAGSGAGLDWLKALIAKDVPSIQNAVDQLKAELKEMENPTKVKEPAQQEEHA